MAALVRDINPLPLNRVQPTPGTPLAITSNYTNAELLAAIPSGVVNSVSVQADPANTGYVYVGRSNLDKTTRAGVLRILSGGESFEFGSSNQLDVFDPRQIYVDTDTEGDGAIPSVLLK